MAASIWRKLAASILTAILFASVFAVRADVASEFTVETFSGNWMGVHPDWKGIVVLRADGVCVRPHFCAGQWSIADDHGTYTVNMNWDAWHPDIVEVRTPDHLVTPERLATPGPGIRLFHLYRIPLPPVMKDVRAAQDPAKLQATKALMDDSKWSLIDNKQITLEAGGDVACDFDARKGNWQVVAPNILRISVPWRPAPPEFVSTNHDGTILRWSDDENILGLREGLR